MHLRLSVTPLAGGMDQAGGMGMGHGMGGMKMGMHNMQRDQGAPSSSGAPPAAHNPDPQGAQALAPTPQCPAGTNIQMDTAGRHFCR